MTDNEIPLPELPPRKQCMTIFKESGHRCQGILGHSEACQDIDWPHYNSVRETV